MSVTYVDHSPQDPIALRSPLFFLVAALGLGFLLTLPVLWDYQFYEKALPYQGYVLSSDPHFMKGSVDYYELRVQFQPPGQAVRRQTLRTEKDHPAGSLLPIVYDPHRGGECREFRPKMDFWGEVAPAFLIRCLIGAALTVLFEFRAWRRKLSGAG